MSKYWSFSFNISPSRPLALEVQSRTTGLSGKSLDSLHFLFKFSFLLYFWLCWVFVAACGLYVVVAWLLLLRSMHFKILRTFFLITLFISIFSIYVYLYIGFLQFCGICFFSPFPFFVLFFLLFFSWHSYSLLYLNHLKYFYLTLHFCFFFFFFFSPTMLVCFLFFALFLSWLSALVLFSVSCFS